MAVPDSFIYGTVPSEEEMPKLQEFMTKIKATEEFKKHELEAEEYVDVELCHRFLCARNYNEKKSLTLLQHHLLWQFETYRPFEIKADEVEEYAKRGAIQTCPRGKDQFGRPIMILDNSKDNVNLKVAKEKQREAMKHLVFNLQRMCTMFEDGVKRYVVFINLKDFNLFDAPPMATTKETINILSSQFPERLGLAVLFKAPWVFSKFYSAVKIFIDKVTRQKVVFITGNTDEGSANDKKLKELIGENWRELTQVDMPRKNKDLAVGYDHEVYWAKVMEHERAMEEKKRLEDKEEKAKEAVVASEEKN